MNGTLGQQALTLCSLTKSQITAFLPCLPEFPRTPLPQVQGTHTEILSLVVIFSYKVT